jgi:hypothetical protein
MGLFSRKKDCACRGRGVQDTHRRTSQRRNRRIIGGHIPEARYVCPHGNSVWIPTR